MIRAIQTYRRHAGEVESVLAWELAGGLSDEERMDREERAAIQQFDGVPSDNRLRG